MTFEVGGFFFFSFLKRVERGSIGGLWCRMLGDRESRGYVMETVFASYALFVRLIISVFFFFKFDFKSRDGCKPVRSVLHAQLFFSFLLFFRVSLILGRIIGLWVFLVSDRLARKGQSVDHVCFRAQTTSFFRVVHVVCYSCKPCYTMTIVLQPISLISQSPKSHVFLHAHATLTYASGLPSNLSGYPARRSLCSPNTFPSYPNRSSPR